MTDLDLLKALRGRLIRDCGLRRYHFFLCIGARGLGGDHLRQRMEAMLDADGISTMGAGFNNEDDTEDLYQQDANQRRLKWLDKKIEELS